MRRDVKRQSPGPDRTRFRLSSLLALSVFLWAAFCGQGAVLSVPETFQEHSQWCWAGTSQPILVYYGQEPTQCEIANWAWTRADCCGNPTFNWDNVDCNYWNYLYGTSGSLQAILAHWGVASAATAAELSQATVTAEIAAGRPFVMRWGWVGGGGHFLAGRGIEGDNVYYMDPWPGNGYETAAYDWVVSAAGDHDWTHSLRLTTDPPPSPSPVAGCTPSPSPSSPPSPAPTRSSTATPTVSPSPTASPAPSPSVPPSPSPSVPPSPSPSTTGSTTPSPGPTPSSSPPPSPSPTTSPSPAPVVRFAVIGDYGEACGNLGPEHEEDVADLVKSWDPDFIITLGDNNYPVGSAFTIDSNIGQFYSDYIYPYTGSWFSSATQNRFWPVMGNHDWYTYPPAPYYDYFALPGNERYYDLVDSRNIIRLFALDSDTNEPDGTSAGSTQGIWLQNGLAASTAVWNIVYLHHCPYSSSSSYAPGVAYMRWPFAAWGADAVLAGHAHHYERLSVDGIPYFVNGAGGGDLYSFTTPQPISQVRYNADWGAQWIEAASDHITFRFFNTAGDEIDSYTLYPPPPTATPTPSAPPTATPSSTPPPTATPSPTA
ncbi:MAG TPA: metallophosphoesterase, partial [bacterium]|nr:metallophosphoesterase [bacterium]